MYSEQFGLDEVETIDRWLGVIRSLPGTNESFSKRYGHLPDTEAQSGFVGAIAAGQALATAFGNVAVLRIDNDSFLENTPPTMSYERYVWLAGRVASNASAIAITIEQLRNRQPVFDSKATLAGPGGLTQRAAGSRTEIAALRDLLNTQRSTATPIIEALSRTDLYDLAGQEIGRLNIAVSKARKELNEIDRRLAGWFANKTRLEGEKHQTALRLAAAESARDDRQRFLNDTKPLVEMSGAVTSAFINMDAKLEQLWTMFDALGNRVNNIVGNASPDQLADGVWLYEALGGESTEHRWRTLSASVENFISSAGRNGPSR